MTVEAAFLLPFFLFVFLNLLSVIEIYRLNSNLSASLWSTGRQLAQYGYLYQKEQEEAGLQGKLAEVAFSEWYIRDRLKQDLSGSPAPELVLRGGSGSIMLLGTSLMEQDQDIISLKAYYEAKPVCSIYPGLKLPMHTSYYGHAWTGYDLSGAGGSRETAQEDYVYITEYGTVYHNNRNCSYLRPAIRSIAGSQLATARNLDGGRYVPCEVCKPDPEGGLFLVTDYGEVYHDTLQCPSLKRTVYQIKRSQVGSRTPCKKCGGSG